MANEELQLVDINTETLSSTWPLLLRAVDHAHFIALDLVREISNDSSSQNYLVSGSF